MSTSDELYWRLIASKEYSADNLSPEASLLRYCKQILGNIEGMHVDFKEKQDRKHPGLGDSDKKNLAKAVSGFANSGGGVLIWGIEDENIKPKPITKVQEFVASLTELAPQVTDPVVRNIEGNSIPSDSDPTNGFALVHIPESDLPPHRVILKSGSIQNHYYVRSGSSFVQASHTQLEDMFGRRPKPNLELSMRLHRAGSGGGEQHFYLLLGIENTGRGSAKSPFLAVKVYSPYRINKYGIDGNGHFGLAPIARSHGSDFNKYGSNSNVVIHPGVTLDVTAISLKVPFNANPSDIEPLNLDFHIAAENSRTIDGSRTLTSKAIWEELPG